MPLWLLIPFFGPVLLYWTGTTLAARRLPAERRRVGDPRPVPELFGLSSHRWFGIVLTENTRAFRPGIRRAFTLARIGLALLPVGFVTTMVLASNLPPVGPSPAAYQDQGLVVLPARNPAPV